MARSIKNIKITSKASLIVCIMSFVLLMAACSGGTAGSSTVKTYTWDDAEFTVKEITDDENVVGDQANTVAGKCVAVVIDFGEDTMSQNSFEAKVANGQFLLAGEKPSNYDYHMSNMTFGGTGFETQITGETKIYFDMDKDYEINGDDLIIKE